MSAIDRFVTDTLQKAGERMLRQQTWAIESAYNKRSGNLLSARKVTVSGADLHFEHPIYERFLDLRSKRKGRNAVDRRIHNRFVYGTWLGITERLMYGFTKEVEEKFRAMEKNG